MPPDGHAVVFGQFPCAVLLHFHCSLRRLNEQDIEQKALLQVPTGLFGIMSGG